MNTEQTFIIIESSFKGVKSKRVEIYNQAHHGKDPIDYQVFYIQKATSSGVSLVPKIVRQQVVTTDKYTVTDAKRFGLIYTLE